MENVHIFNSFFQFLNNYDKTRARFIIVEGDNMRIDGLKKYMANTSHPTFVALFGVLSAITLYSGGTILGYVKPFLIGLLGLIALGAFRLWVFGERFGRMPRTGLTFFREGILGVLLPQAALASAGLMFISTQFPKVGDGPVPGFASSAIVFIVALALEVGLTLFVNSSERWQDRPSGGVEIIRGDEVPESKV